MAIRIALLSVMLVCTMLTSSCDKPDEVTYTRQDSLGCVDIAHDEPLQIGVLQAVSGAVVPLGQAQVRGLELAVESRDNTFLGHPISLQIEDTGCTPEGGAAGVCRVQVFVPGLGLLIGGHLVLRRCFLTMRRTR